MTDALPRPPVCFYGDDFTGSTAHLAGFHAAGLRALLFLDTPPHEVARRYLPQLDVLGIAGISRSLGPDALAAEVVPAFDLFGRLRARQVHYKVCSTFDSSPAIGSIGAVMDIARQRLDPAQQHVVIACPRFGRHVVFGHLFASAGAAGVVRLDRHPTMARHPATPMDESDLRLHLGRQTQLRDGLVDVTVLHRGAAALEETARRLLAAGNDYLLFDGLEDEDLDAVAAFSLKASRRDVIFSVAAQGLAEAMGRRMASADPAAAPPALAPLADVDRMLVLSGSAAPQNAVQIERALAQGWCGIAIDAARLLADPAEVLRSVGTAMLAALAEGRSVIAYTARGPADPALARVRDAVAAAALPADALTAAIGGLFAELARRAVAAGQRRLIVAGGDSASHATRRLGADALSIVGYGVQGGRLCRLHAHDGELDGVEIMLKGGQVGGTDTFVDAARATGWRDRP